MQFARALLLVSMALQGAVSLTFGLAFFGLWRGFHRRAALRWACAWIVYAVGVVFALLVIVFRLGAGGSPVGNALLAIPLQIGTMLFRAGTDSLSERDVPGPRRYVIAGASILAVFIAFREANALGFIRTPPNVAQFMLPRFVMGVSFIWAAWPLRSAVARRGQEGVTLMAAALGCLGLRMFGSVAYEAWQMTRQVADPAESPMLTVAQVCLLIVFGVATALVLIEMERLDAVRAAETIRETSEALRQSEAALMHTRWMDNLGRMAGNIAHDFNNTLTVIAASLGLGLDDLPADSPAASSFQLAQTATTRAASLTRQLLTFARQIPPTSELFDLNARLASIEDMVALAVGRGVCVQLALSDGPLPVRADPVQFDQVIMNLAINSRDAMPSAGTLTIRSRPATTQETRQVTEPPIVGPWARIVVEDTGVGIPPQILDRIFEPFFTTKPEGKGTGLGLASAYGFARLAGGRLSVESTAGAGAAFRLDLPLDNAV